MEIQAANSIDSNTVTAWFGEMFFELHPGLQSLHRHGGVLKGKIQLNFGKGLAGVLGKRIARKLGVPLQPGARITSRNSACRQGIELESLL